MSKYTDITNLKKQKPIKFIYVINVERNKT
jgi:hypothetical protein